MLITNETSFPHFGFEHYDLAGQMVHVCVVRGTFDISSTGILAATPAQQPPVMVDTHYGDPRNSSMREESDLALFKPQSDIYFTDPVACSPTNMPEKSWVVRISVGSRSQSFVVTGERSWKRNSIGAWVLSEPEPCVAVPIRYELAFGGSIREGQKTSVCDQNPIGRGFASESGLRDYSNIPAPQIEAQDDPILQVGKPYRVVGLTPVGRGWSPRRQRAGTFDQAWREQRWPLMPTDFELNYHNCAPPALQYQGFLRGDEAISIEGLSPAGKTTFNLCGIPRLSLHMFCLDGKKLAVLLSIDTLVINLNENRVGVVWRHILKNHREVFYCRIRLST